MGDQWIKSEDSSNCAFVPGHETIRPVPEFGDPLSVRPGVPAQFDPGRTVTVNVFVAALPHWSKAVTWTVLIEFSGKQ
jgi:hypothetical protein